MKFKEQILKLWPWLDDLGVAIEQALVDQSCSKIRQESLRQCKLELQKAEQENKPINQTEWTMGLRLENIEPEVRFAVSLAQQSRHTTTGSGYEGVDGIHMLNLVANKPPPQKLLSAIENLSNTTSILTIANSTTARYIYEQYNDGKPIIVWNINFFESSGDRKTIKDHWDRIGQLFIRFPNPSSQLITQAPFAQKFRETHQLKV